MKKTLLMAGALLALTAGIASAAGGINLSWNDCGAAGTASKTFACTSNTLTGAIMVASAIAPVPMDQLNGEESEMLLQTNAAALSPWWHLETGGCRSALSASFDFTSGPFTCADVWTGNGAGGLSYDANYLGAPNRARIRTIGAIPGSTAIDDVTEYYFFKVTLLGAKTTGTGACAGCTDGMCIVFTQLKLTQPLGVGDYTLTNPILRQHVTWQTGGSLAGQCPAATPTQTRTWGSVKSLYR